jgi:hypothetical protein
MYNWWAHDWHLEAGPPGMNRCYGFTIMYGQHFIKKLKPGEVCSNIGEITIEAPTGE